MEKFNFNDCTRLVRVVPQDGVPFICLFSDNELTAFKAKVSYFLRKGYKVELYVMSFGCILFCRNLDSSDLISL